MTDKNLNYIDRNIKNMDTSADLTLSSISLVSRVHKLLKKLG